MKAIINALKKNQAYFRKGDRIWGRVIKNNFSEEVTFEEIVSTGKNENEIINVLYQFNILKLYIWVLMCPWCTERNESMLER